LSLRNPAKLACLKWQSGIHSVTRFAPPAAALIKHLLRINDDLFQLCKLLNEKQKSDFHRA